MNSHGDKMSVEITIPEIVNEEKYRGMNSQDQQEYIREKISELLEENENGVQVSDIDNSTPFSRTTIVKHLEKLVSKREAYKIKRGNFTLYYPNGKPQHPEQRTKTELASGEKVRATFLNNSFGRFIYIENMEEDGVTGGGILLNRSDLQKFADFVDSVSEKGENFDAKLKTEK